MSDWTLDRKINVSLIMSVVGTVFLAGVSHATQQVKIEMLSEQVTEMKKDTKGIDVLISKVGANEDLLREIKQTLKERKE